MLLVIGSQGLLGRHVTAYFQRAGVEVVCASHRPGNHMRLDLENPLDGLARVLPESVTHALLCSSITDIDRCYSDPAGTWRLNVTHTLILLQALIDRGIEPIFCSSDLVFKGDRGDYTESDPSHPTTEYGRQKQAVETFLINQNAPSLILRMSKLYSVAPNDPSPVGQMLNALLAGLPVRCAHDQVICPTFVDDVAHIISWLITAGAAGVYHVAATQRYTRFSLGCYLANQVGTPHLVDRCSIQDFHFAEPRPCNNSLSVDKLVSTTGFSFTNLDEVMSLILEQRRTPHMIESES